MLVSLLWKMVVGLKSEAIEVLYIVLGGPPLLGHTALKLRGRENFDMERRNHGMNDTAWMCLPVKAHACRYDSLSIGVAKGNDIICALTTLKLLSFPVATPVPS